ncbi:UDP-N-acetylmuramoyl-L-alanine--D-glutamate ligase [Alteribacter populi]|uniref:UDP-N-acetylmuramoyl-L-alanine--D-glutamate ligase n=1 Tax=Alteribacter populi TaxID=2011011 RepID=UPI000BBAA6D4|nr:UDP-N-acetylmuramoyl-L-alanine--D-glutamate ligase [Alteribacter populi]
MKDVRDFVNQEVLVLGLAKSGTAAARLLLKLGARVTVNDQKQLEENEAAQMLEKEGCRVVCGDHPLSLVHDQVAFVIKNPGIRYDNPLVAKALQKDIPVITEVELAYRISEAPIVGITGSNGKTTTTTLIDHMLQFSSYDPLIAGNIGKVSCEVAQEASEKNVMVTELSSFQLMGVDTFKPEIAVLLNLIDAHLDYHGSREAYANAKGQLFKNLNEQSVIVYNYDDLQVREMAERVQAKLLPFSVKEKLTEGAWIENDDLIVNGEPILHRDEMSLPGEHNIENAMAAALVARHYQTEVDRIAFVLKNFSGVKHRLQYLKSIKGRKFYNNSKATNIPATITALKAFTQPVVLIAGGLDRGNEFDELIPWLKGKVRAVVTYGETSEKIARVTKEAGIPVYQADFLEQAVPKAYSESSEGDIVLLSPACASWDQFKTFEVRGDCFIEAVEKLDS